MRASINKAINTILMDVSLSSLTSVSFAGRVVMDATCGIYNSEIMSCSCGNMHICIQHIATILYHATGLIGAV